MTAVTHPEPSPSEQNEDVPVDRFGVRLAAIRAERGWNIAQAAEHCGQDAQSWANWERGRGPQRMEERAREIAEAAGFDYRWLLAGGPLRNRCFSIVPSQGTQQMELIDRAGVAWNTTAGELHVVR